MLTQFLGTAATAYGVLGALKTLLQTRQMLARRASREVSAGFLASYAGGYAIWLAYGFSTGSVPLIVVDTVGLLCAGLTLAVALSLRGSLIRPATWNSRTETLVSQRPAAPGGITGLRGEATVPFGIKIFQPNGRGVLFAPECVSECAALTMRR